jgi:hypothetical protein
LWIFNKKETESAGQTLSFMGLNTPVGKELQFVYVEGKFGFQVGSFIGMDDVPFSQLIQHGDNFGQQFGCDAFFRCRTNLFHSVPGCFGIVPVPCSPGSCLSDSLFC